MHAQIQPAEAIGVMLLAAGYFDESTDGDFEDRVFSVGGYVTAGWNGLQLDFRWNDLLAKYGLRYFKSSELESGIGEFAKFRDNPATASKDRFTDREKELLKNIKIEFVNLICAEKELIGVSATVHMRHLKAFAHDHPELASRLPPAYEMCSHLVLMRSGILLNDTNDEVPSHLQGQLRPIFDSHKEFSRRLEKSFPIFREKNPESSRGLLDPLFEDDKTYKCLQAADLLVYEIRRTISNHFFEPRVKLRAAMERLFPQTMNTYILDYDTLKMLAECQSSDRIPIEPL